MSDLRNINIIIADLSAAHYRVDLNVEYACKEGRTLHLYIIRPVTDNEDEKFPLIVFSQGSSWMKQDLGKEITQLARFATKGYVIAIAEYRSVEETGFPSQILDTKTAVYFMKQNAHMYHVDVDNIILWGTSSGGHTVLMAAVTADLQKFSDEPLDKYPFNIKAVIDYYGPTDITKIVSEEEASNYQEEESPLTLLVGDDDIWHHPDLTDPMIPMHYISKTKSTVPILIAHGNVDTMVPYKQSIELFNCLKENDKETEIYILKGANHGGGCFWTAEMLTIVDTFIRKYLTLNIDSE